MMAVIAIFLVLGFEVAGLAPAMFIAAHGSSDNISLLKVSDKNVSGTENGNVTTKGNVFLNQTKDTAGNQTVLAINDSNTTSANGSIAEILTNASQQPLAPLQSLRSLLPAPSQSQQQQPSTLQQQLPPLSSPLNLLPPRSSPQQQNPLSLMQPSQQMPPPIGGPLDQLGQTLGFQQPSTMIPPPSTPLYPVPPFPSAESNDPGIQPEDRFLINEPRAPPPLKVLSQNAENKPTLLGNGRILEISGEIMNVSPTGEVFDAGTGEYVKIIVTLYDAYGQIVGSDSGLIGVNEKGGQGLYPNQIYTYDAVIAQEDVSIPINEVHSFSIKPAWLLD